MATANPVPASSSSSTSKRAAFYIDGFNLYHAIDALAKPHLKWFSLVDYANFVTAQRGEPLVHVHYFSALAPDNSRRAQ